MKTLTLENDITITLTKIENIKEYRGFSIKINGIHYISNFNTGAIPSTYDVETHYHLGFDMGDSKNIADYLLRKLRERKQLNDVETEAYKELITPLANPVHMNGYYYNFRPYLTKLKGHKLWILNSDKILDFEMNFLECIPHIDIDDLI